MKIKEFKGSLNAIFGEEVDNQLIVEQEEFAKERNLKNSLRSLPLNRIRPREDQPRKLFDEIALEELTQSIKSKGVIQPIVVRPVENGLYEIIVGERRWRAAQRAGLEEIPTVVKDYDKPDRMAIALIENIQRENLNPLEEAQAIQSLLDEYSMTHTQVAENIGKSRATVSNLLRLLTLENEVKAMVNAKLLEMGHARALLGLSGQSQIDAAKQIIGRSLTVRETEALVRRLSNPIEKQLTVIDPSFEQKANEWKTHLARQLSSKVNVHLGPEGKGRVVIHFDSIDEADWLMNHLKFSEV